MSDQREGMEGVIDLVGDDWDIGGFDDTFICPCGTEIELDGECPDGHVSPMRELGMI